MFGSTLTIQRKIASRFWKAFPPSVVRERLFSLLFGTAVIASYYGIEWLIPGQLEYYSEIVTILFILASVFLLFPAREFIYRQILNREDYDRIFGLDQHHIDFIARQFTMKSMIYEIFPRMMTWLRVESGRISVMDPARRQFHFYILRRGKVLERSVSYNRSFDELIDYLRGKKRPLFIYQPDLPEPVREFMERFRVYMLVPFLYRRRPMGFLILHREPGHRYANRALDIFARKAAVSIHNESLSVRASEVRFFKQEISTARRVQKLLQAGNTMKCGPWFLKVVRNRRLPAIVEYIRGDNGKEYAAIAATRGYQGAAGIVLAGVVGRLYSLRMLDRPADIHEILFCLKKDQDATPPEFRPDILVIELSPGEQEAVIHGDANFALQWDSRDETLNPSHRGNLEIAPGTTLHISHRGLSLLDLKNRGGSAN